MILIERIETAFKVLERHGVEVLMEVGDFSDGCDPEPMSMVTMLSHVYKTLQNLPPGPGFRD